jgi:DNA-binding MarR family transcriptional regulator
VSREVSPVDARSAIVSLTTSGKAALKRAPRPSQVRLTRALSELADGDRRRLAAGLTALVSAMRLEGPVEMFFEEDAARTPRRRSTKAQ